MNKKGIEGLPMKYVIIAIIAAISLAIILEVTGVLRTGIIHAANSLNETLNASLP